MEIRKPVEVLLVDDHTLFLEGMKNFLVTNGFVIAATARNGSEAMLKYEMTKPDLVLMDLQMSYCDGIETTRQMKQQFPEATIVILTACEDETSLFSAMQAGASGYLVKGMEPDQFLHELDKCAQGEIPLAPGMAARMLEFLISKPQTPSNLKAESLSPRQEEILKLVVQGQTYKEIAYQLDLKEVTVKYHIKEMLKKLQLINRSELITFAIKQGLI